MTPVSSRDTPRELSGPPFPATDSISLSDVVSAALVEVGAEGDTAEVAVKLARKVQMERGSGPSAARELRYALLALGVQDLAPYRALMACIKAAIDRSGENLPSLALQHRETGQLIQKLAGEPRNSVALRSATEAVEAHEALWEAHYQDWLRRRDGDGSSDWEAFRLAGQANWDAFNAAGGEDAFPALAERMGRAFDSYWTRRRAVSRAGRPQIPARRRS
jgi:hypothetical protein